MKEIETFDDLKAEFMKMGPTGKVASVIWVIVGTPIFLVLGLLAMSAGLGLIGGILVGIYSVIKGAI